MQKMIDAIEKAIAEKYEDIKKQGKIIKGIDEVHFQIGFSHPELAAHIKKRMWAMAKEKDDLP